MRISGNDGFWLAALGAVVWVTCWIYHLLPG